MQVNYVQAISDPNSFNRAPLSGIIKTKVEIETKQKTLTLLTRKNEIN